MKKIQILTWIFAALFLAAACSSGGDEPANPGGNEGGGGGEPQPEANVTSQVYKPGESGYAAFRIPAVVVSKAGTVLAFAEGRVDGSADDGNIDLLVKRSEDNGNTWSTPIKVYDDGENRCQNPAPVVLDNGRILLLFCWNERTPGSANGSGSSGHPRRVMKTYSDDDGKTWSAPEDIHDQVAIAGYTWYATGPCHAIVKTLAPNKGRIVVPCNHNKPGTNPKSERHAHLIYSDDQGATWHLGAVTDHPYGNESTVVELGDGSLMTNMRNYEPNSLGYRWQAVSRDGGLTYEPAQVTTLIEPNNNGCQGSILRYSINSAGKANLLFSNPDHGSSRRNGSIKLSSNDGRSWSRTFKYVPDNDFYSAYSDLAVLANKKVGVLFEHGHNNGKGVYFRSFEFAEIAAAL
ncbi:sialidase family protein [Alistipes finegoldii]|uniref:sialidase family protein n=1 Tax=Alistipes finegoldii TaxID=214856 RepID=UPI0025854EA7|nr:sialidase family protein [uncultured Alistipes sp.]